MVGREGKPDDEVWSRMGPHEEFLELCALSTAGGLTTEEQNRLWAHLAACSDCREAMKQFETVVDKDISALAPELASNTPYENPSWSTEEAEAAFFKRLSEEGTGIPQHRDETNPSSPPFVIPPGHGFNGVFDRFHFWLPLAAAALLCATLGILTYRMGMRRGVDVARLEHGSSQTKPPGPDEPSEATLRERDAAQAQLAERDKAISELRGQMALQSVELAKLKALQVKQQQAAQMGNEEKQQLAQERDRLTQQQEAQQADLLASEKKLNALEQQRLEDVVYAAGLEAKVADLSRAVKDQERTTD
jgi:hypothetical protein